MHKLWSKRSVTGFIMRYECTQEAKKLSKISDSLGSENDRKKKIKTQK